MSNKIPGLTKHPKGRAEGEAFDGLTALVNHAHRQRSPFLLAQTKDVSTRAKLLAGDAPLEKSSTIPTMPVRPDEHTKEECLGFLKRLYRQSNDEVRIALAEKNYAKLSELTGAPAYTFERTMIKAGLAQPLPPEPAPAMVNTAAEPVATTESTLSTDTMKVAYTKHHLALITSHDNAELIGRLGNPVIRFREDDPDHLFVFAPFKSETGRMWGVYRDGAEGMSRCQIARSAVTEWQFPEEQNPLYFGLSDSLDWTQVALPADWIEMDLPSEGKGILIRLPREGLALMKDAGGFKIPPHTKKRVTGRHKQTPDTVRRSSAEVRLENLIDDPVTLDTLGDNEVAVAETTVAEVVNDPLVAAIQIPGLRSAPTTVKASAAVCVVEPRLTSDAMAKQLAARVDMINASKRELGDDLQLFIDTTTGELRARTRVSIWQDIG